MRFKLFVIILILQLFLRNLSDAFQIINSCYHSYKLRILTKFETLPLFLVNGNKESSEFSWDPRSAPKLDFDEDFYTVLEVDPSCSQQDLKKAYYKVVFKYHPDK